MPRPPRYYDEIAEADGWEWNGTDDGFRSGEVLAAVLIGAVIGVCVFVAYLVCTSGDPLQALPFGLSFIRGR